MRSPSEEVVSDGWMYPLHLVAAGIYSRSREIHAPRQKRFELEDSFCIQAEDEWYNLLMIMSC